MSHQLSVNSEQLLVNSEQLLVCFIANENG